MTFDIEHAKKHGAQTRNGQPVQIITFEGRGKWPIVGYIDRNNRPKIWTKERPKIWTKEGRFVSENTKHPLDLVNIPVKREGWVNLYSYSPDHVRAYPGGAIYNTFEEARDQSASIGYLGTAKIEWEE